MLVERIFLAMFNFVLFSGEPLPHFAHPAATPHIQLTSALSQAVDIFNTYGTGPIEN